MSNITLIEVTKDAGILGDTAQTTNGALKRLGTSRKDRTVETEPMTETDMTQPSPSGKRQLDDRRTARQLSNEDRKTPER